MKFVPTRYDLFNTDFFEDFFNSPIKSNGLMKTDVHEKNGYYTLDIELPGYNKEDIKMDLVDGNLVIKASHNMSDEEKDEKGNLIRSERYFGSCSRSFYVGENLKAEDIKAKFENGILSINCPSKQQKSIETAQTISIE